MGEGEDIITSLTPHFDRRQISFEVCAHANNIGFKTWVCGFTKETVATLLCKKNAT